MAVSLSIGDTLNAEIPLEIGGASETINISADTAVTINTSDFKVDGVITRQKIDGLPLNGRNFLQLASLEPGVRVSTGSPGDANNLFNVSIGGGNSDLTRLTVDGGNIVDPVTGGAGQNFSVDTVQEFQISSFNFDLATGVTSVGAINIVSRTGGNEYHGSGFGYFRDHHMGAYPLLQRQASNPDPFFRRLQAGFTLGGPIVKDKLSWFTNLERLNQATVFASTMTGIPVLSQFNTISSSPYKGWLYNLRFDYTLNSKNIFFLRYASDNNKVFGPTSSSANAPLASNWRVNKNDVYQGQAGWTSTIKPTLTNQLSFNYQQIGNKSLIPTNTDCANCLGLGGAQIRINGSNFQIGNSTDAPQTRSLFRYETNENLTWSKGKHIIQTGMTWEKSYGQGSWSFVDPAIVVAHDPRTVADVNGAIDALAGGLGLPANDPTGQLLRGLFGPVAPSLKLPLPAAFTTPGAKITQADILALPVAFIVRGLGDGSQPPPFNTDFARHTQRWRFYGQDTWNVGKGLTLKYGLSYVYEDKLWNHDLKKSTLFANTGLYGTTNANTRDKNNFAPALGFAWDVKQQGKTVVRGGFSMSYDTSLFVNRLTERAILGPLGNGRVILPGDFFQNTIAFPQLPAQVAGALPQVSASLLAFANTPGLDAATRGLLQTLGGAIVPNLGVINPVQGARLSSATLQVLPTKLTTAQALQLVAQQGTLIQGQFNQLAQAGVIGADFFKTVTQTSVLIDPNIKIPYSTTVSIGVQHQLPWNMVVNTDFVWRRYLHGFFQRDRALWNRPASLGGPIIPACTAAQATNPTVRCLNGPFEVVEGSGREDYKALLVKLEKRFAKRYQFTGSYALSRLRGFNYGRNLTNPFDSPGFSGNDRPHVFSFSGLADLPFGIKAGVIVNYESGAPISVSIPGSNNSDLNGDGTNNDYLPGTSSNTVNRGVNAAQLRKLVDDYNTNFAGKTAPRGGQFPRLAPLPSDFSLGDSFQSHNLRISKEFNIIKEKLKLELIGEVYNIFNLSNKLSFTSGLDSGFGVATDKVNPNFGIGGPRIFQIGGRLKF